MSDTLPWQQIFLPAEAPATGITVQMRLLRKNGNPFLLLPQNRRMAAAAMELYAPQTTKARWMARVFRLASRITPLGRIEPQSLYFRPDDPFLLFLGEVAGTSEPKFAMLAGNPNTPGQRNIFLLFNDQGRIAAVVKAGSGEAAIQLIEQEIKFLKSAPPGLASIPGLRASFSNHRLSAFAMDFFPGASPASDNLSSACKVIASWVDPQRTVRISDLRIWKSLLSRAGASLSPMTRELGGKVVSRAIYHGDFAPWNIRARRGNWTVLDWERGDLQGMPLWDLLHFIIQPAILVERASLAETLLLVATSIENHIVREYMAEAKVTEFCKPLLMAYLEYCLHVTRQTEGLDSIKALAKIVDKYYMTPTRGFLQEFGLRER
jgi:hypothetical protein